MISDLNAQQIPQKAGCVMDSLNDKRQASCIRWSPRSIKPDRQGVTAGANIRESLTNANAATLNLADETEALKHNFLLRGFFQERGYYNLDAFRRNSIAATRPSPARKLPGLAVRIGTVPEARTGKRNSPRREGAPGWRSDTNMAIPFSRAP